MFWVMNVSERKGSKKQGLNVHYDRDENNYQGVQSDLDVVPFCLELNRGNAQTRIYFSKGELECISAQILQVLQEHDRDELDKMSPDWQADMELEG